MRRILLSPAKTGYFSVRKNKILDLEDPEEYIHISRGVEKRK